MHNNLTMIDMTTLEEYKTLLTLALASHRYFVYSVKESVVESCKLRRTTSKQLRIVCDQEILLLLLLRIKPSRTLILQSQPPPPLATWTLDHQARPWGPINRKKRTDRGWSRARTPTTPSVQNVLSDRGSCPITHAAVLQSALHAVMHARSRLSSSLASKTFVNEQQ